MQETGCGVGGLLHAKPEEGGVVSACKLQADLAINHRHQVRRDGEDYAKTGRARAARLASPMDTGCLNGEDPVVSRNSGYNEDF